MSEQIWIVRDPSGKVVAASASDPYLAANEVRWRNGTALMDAIDNTLGPTYTANGYTLTRESLTPAPRVVVTEAMVERAIRVGRDYGYFDWDESGEERFAGMRAVLTAALAEAPADGA